MYSNFEFQITRDGQADKAIEQWPVPLQGGDRLAARPIAPGC